MIKAKLVRDEEVAPGSLRIVPTKDLGVFLEQGHRRGSRTTEGVAYIFSSPDHTEGSALAWLAEHGIVFLSIDSPSAVAEEPAAAPAPTASDPTPAAQDDGQQEAIQDDDGTYSMRNVPVMRAGKWVDKNGQQYETTEERMDALALATNANIELLKPTLSLGHGGEKDGPVGAFPRGGAPAFGTIQGLKRKGDLLLADLKRVPSALVDAIKKGHYRRQSVEVLQNWKNPNTGDLLPEVMTGLAVLGARLPAITNLPELLAMEHDQAQVIHLSGMPGEWVDEPEAGGQTTESVEDQNPEPKEKIMAEEAKITELESTIAKMKATLVDRTLTTAVEQRRITPAQVDAEKAILLSMPHEALDASCNALMARPQMPDPTQPVSGAKVEDQKPEIKGATAEEKLVNLASDEAEARSIPFEAAYQSVCKKNPGIYDEYRRDAFRPVNTGGK